ncbi:hypothetical protein [Amycolatopsis thermoflava]|nr:hypothetical protein [Amycolatopsis thermoflava]
MDDWLMLIVMVKDLFSTAGNGVERGSAIGSVGVHLYAVGS